MRNFILTILFLSTTITHSQIAFSDDFKDGIKHIKTAKGYKLVTSKDNKLLILSSGSKRQWDFIDYNLYKANSNNNIDIVTSPKIFIKAKSSSPVSVRVDLKDGSGFTTNFEATSKKILTTFKVYEYDFSGKFMDGGYGGPCTNAPCGVNPLDIKNLNIFIDPGVGKFDGDIEIEWISVGAPLETKKLNAIDIRYNQVGYSKNKTKLISLTSNSPFKNIPYTITTNEGNNVTEGVTGEAKLWDDAQLYVANIEIDGANENGVYKIAIPDNEAEFTVSQNPFNALAEQSLKYFYLNRASIKIDKKYGDDWARPLALADDKVYIHKSAESEERPKNFIISSPKGWFDAGDYNKYVVNAGISTFTLLSAYEHFPEYYTLTTTNIPESENTLPDILDEVNWSLDWLLTMQDPNDGGVYHKLTGLDFTGTIMPEDYKEKRYVVQKSTAATLNFAAVTAQASRVFENFETEKPGFSKQLLEASIKAYEWAKKNPEQVYKQPAEVKTGEYGDTNLADEFRWAATELFVTTKNDVYKQDASVSNISNDLQSWNYVDPLALITLTHHKADFKDLIDTETATNKLLESADKIKARITSSAMNISLETKNYNWGSNGNKANQIMLLIRAYEATNDDTYLKAAFTATDYLLGRNGTGYCFVTGFGKQQVFNPHHRISESDSADFPNPGMLVGGPNPGQQDKCNGYPNTNPATSYVDDYCSYASNEIAINWNAPLAYVMNALSYYQTKK